MRAVIGRAEPACHRSRSTAHGCRRHAAGVANTDNPALKYGTADLAWIGDQRRAEGEQTAAAARERNDPQIIKRPMARTFPAVASERLRLNGGGGDRDQLRGPAQRVEAATRDGPSHRIKE